MKNDIVSHEVVKESKKMGEFRLREPSLCINCK